MANPTCYVNGSSTLNGIDVTAASTVTIALHDTAGVTSWVVTCINTDENSNKTTINTALAGSISQVTKTATFTAPAAGGCLIFKSVINNGRNINNQPDTNYTTTTFEVNTLTAGGARVLATNERYEGSANFGWITKLNYLIRNFTGGAGAGAGLYFSSGTYNVGQNADGSIVVNADDIQLKASYQTLLNGATDANTASTLMKRDASGIVATSRLNTSVISAETAGGNIGIGSISGVVTITSAGAMNVQSTAAQTVVAGLPISLQTTNASSIKLNYTGTDRVEFSYSTISTLAKMDMKGGGEIVTTGALNLYSGGGITLTNDGGTFLIEDPAGGGITIDCSGGGAFLLDAPSSLTLRGGTLELDAAGALTYIVKPSPQAGVGVTGTHLGLFGGESTGGTDTGGNLLLIAGIGTNFNGNIGLGGTPSHTPAAGGGAGVIYVKDRSVAPSTNPTSGFSIYSESTVAKIRSGANTVTLGNKPSVTGSKASGAALASLLTVLATAGIITDSTTA